MISREFLNPENRGQLIIDIHIPQPLGEQNNYLKLALLCDSSISSRIFCVKNGAFVPK